MLTCVLGYVLLALLCGWHVHYTKGLWAKLQQGAAELKEGAAALGQQSQPDSKETNAAQAPAQAQLPSNKDTQLRSGVAHSALGNTKDSSAQLSNSNSNARPVAHSAQLNPLEVVLTASDISGAKGPSFAHGGGGLAGNLAWKGPAAGDRALVEDVLEVSYDELKKVEGEQQGGDDLKFGSKIFSDSLLTLQKKMDALYVGHENKLSGRGKAEQCVLKKTNGGKYKDLVASPPKATKNAKKAVAAAEAAVPEGEEAAVFRGAISEEAKTLAAKQNELKAAKAAEETALTEYTTTIVNPQAIALAEHAEEMRKENSEMRNEIAEFYTATENAASVTDLHQKVKTFADNHTTNNFHWDADSVIAQGPIAGDNDEGKTLNNSVSGGQRKNSFLEAKKQQYEDILSYYVQANHMREDWEHMASIYDPILWLRLLYNHPMTDFWRELIWPTGPTGGPAGGLSFGNSYGAPSQLAIHQGAVHPVGSQANGGAASAGGSSSTAIMARTYAGPGAKYPGMVPPDAWDSK